MNLDKYDIGSKRPSLTVRCGMRFKIESSGLVSEFILAQVGSDLVSFIGLGDGNRFQNPIKVECVSNISSEEIKKMIGSSSSLSNVEYLGE